ncbi:MAG: hypothetical protein K8S62_07050 [Candidatus Sabulitectum sp.]|nr:hypothetical protein [Candidatus Sabulitectum sp.]
MKIILCLCIFPGILLAANFSDNFDEYSPSDDLGDSIYWLRLDPGGNLVAADDSGNMIVEAIWNTYNYMAYACLGSLVWSDGEISTDIRFNGTETVFGLLARVNPLTGECYIGGIYPVYPPIGATVIVYVNTTGDFTILANDYFYPLNENTWYNMSFEVTGSNPVNLKVSIDGTANSEVQDSTYDLNTGMAGLGGSYEGAAPTFHLDNFSVLDYASDLASTTFGGIKALFR